MAVSCPFLNLAEKYRGTVANADKTLKPTQIHSMYKLEAKPIWTGPQYQRKYCKAQVRNGHYDYLHLSFFSPRSTPVEHWWPEDNARHWVRVLSKKKSIDNSAGVLSYQEIRVPNTKGAPRYRRLTASAYVVGVAGALVMKIRATNTVPVDMFPAMHVERTNLLEQPWDCTIKLMSKHVNEWLTTSTHLHCWYDACQGNEAVDQFVLTFRHDRTFPGFHKVN